MAANFHIIFTNTYNHSKQSLTTEPKDKKEKTKKSEKKKESYSVKRPNELRSCVQNRDDDH